MEVDESKEVPKLQLDGEELNADSRSTLAPSWSSYGEKMVAGMRSEPALPLIDDTVAGETDHASIITKGADDSASLHSTSTSSRSFFRPGTFKRRATNQSMTEKEKEHARNLKAKAAQDEEEEDTGLSHSVDLELQQRKEAGDWGIADEARMSLE